MRQSVSLRGPSSMFNAVTDDHSLKEAFSGFGDVVEQDHNFQELLPTQSPGDLVTSDDCASEAMRNSTVEAFVLVSPQSVLLVREVIAVITLTLGMTGTKYNMLLVNNIGLFPCYERKIMDFVFL
ncbi:hypothetical protein L1987_82114 [Smallanthus sonchifolius]|uniref:Uncharacterized protein n=1 Tax=Smallanthus sonchifolius TaxID=185202 RepID=A0ACB8YRM5_9ASTR|nr:hypothetical protein L1987_82114 [Smallanthus sonchifolius]